MIWVREEDRQRIAKGGNGLVKRDAVLAEIRRGLVRVPLELVGHPANLGGWKRSVECA